MAVEIEAKMRCDDPEALRRRLVEAGAARVGEVMETNIFFDTEDRSLLAADQGLRLRINRDPAGGELIILTFKGPRQHGVLKSREEIELRVDSEENAALMLERLGYRRVLTFAKRRESWTLENCQVELDKLPRLGSYVEIEGPSEADVLRIRQRLALSDAAPIRASYIALLMTWLQEHGVQSRVVLFEEGE